MTDLPTPETPQGKARHEDVAVSAAGEGARIDAFLAEHLTGDPSRTRIKALIEQGQVALNDAVCRTPNRRLRAGDRIRVQLPEPVPTRLEGEDIALDIFFEDEHLIVVNKPPGLIVHPAPGNWSGTLVNALIRHCGDSLRGIGGERRPGIVHRLDQYTSGLLVAAKTQAAHNKLSQQFADHGKKYPLRRHYLAISWGKFDRREGTIDAPLGRATANRLKRAVVGSDRRGAKPAITRYKVVAGLDGNGDKVADGTIVECRLETGRTHQIRVHLAHIGHPLIGDPLYGTHFLTKANTLREPARAAVAGFRRQALHAAGLGFAHPETGKPLNFEAPMPADMDRLLSSFTRLD